MFETSVLMSGIIFSSIGMGYFMYGKKASRSVPLLSGIILMVYPYMMTNVTYIIIIGVVMMILPLVLKFDF